MSNLFNTYVAGGVEFMHPITLLLVFNLVIIGYIIYNRASKKVIHPNWLEGVKHLGAAAVAIGTLGTLTGLFLAFNALEHMENVVPLQIIMGGLKVALINILYGLIVFLFSMIVYVIMKLTEVKTVGSNDLTT